MADLVTLNVGGSLYTTTVATLTRYPDSMLGSMFSDRIPSHRDSNGHYIIDGDGPIFRHVLNFLRRSSLCLPHDFKEWDLLRAEADFFQIQELMDAVGSLKEERSGEGSRQEMEFTELSFCDTWRYDIHVPTNGNLTYRGTAATLKAIPTLWSFFEARAHANQKANIAESVDAAGQITTGELNATVMHVMGLVNRMKIYQEITRLGFGLLNSSITTIRLRGQDREDKKTDIKLFGRIAKT